MEYQKFCKSCEFGDYLNYSLYIHGWLIPWLDEQRSTGKISFTEANSNTKKGRKLVKKLQFYGGDSFAQEYKGEIDMNRMACGEGTFKFQIQRSIVRVSGTWYKNKRHGICKFWLLFIILTHREMDTRWPSDHRLRDKDGRQTWQRDLQFPSQVSKNHKNNKTMKAFGKCEACRWS